MKRHVNLSIDDFLFEKAQARRLNVSALVEDMLRQILDTFNKTIDPETCKHDWTWPFATPRGLIKECKKCGKFKRVIMEGSREEAELIKEKEKLIKEGAIQS